MSENFVHAERLPRLTLRGAQPNPALTESSLEVREPEPEPATLVKRVCPPGSRILYAIPNRTPPAEVCVGVWAYATCLILVTSVAAVFTTLSLTTGNWIKAGVGDASSAGLPTKRSDQAAPLTWGDLYNFTKAAGTSKLNETEATALGFNAPISPIEYLDAPTWTYSKADKPAGDYREYVATALEFHEDGFLPALHPQVPTPFKREWTTVLSRFTSITGQMKVTELPY